MKALKIFTFIFYMIFITNLSLANPIILFHINEVQIDSSGWKLELKNLVMITSLDSCYLTTMTDTAYFKPSIVTTDSCIVITQDSLLDSLAINPLGDIVGLHYLDEHLLDQIGFGNITSGSYIAAPLIHQSISLREWDGGDGQRYYFYLDNTPTLGSKNDALNAKGHVSGIIADSTGNPIPQVMVVYDYFYSLGMRIDIFVLTDSTGKFVLYDYARYNTITIIKQNYQAQNIGLQIWPEDTVSINITMSYIIDKIETDKTINIDKYTLSQNYPNPFNNATAFNYFLPKNSLVEISVYDLSGKLVEKLFSGEQSLGEYKVTWNAGSISSGIYLYQLRTTEFTTYKKCLLIK